ncbi:F0F1 ATP synthase subunit A [Levilactobacillus lindianensis]|nr:F0F1 ATP synthase subunit A [Levilactobacillus lindianensis]
MGSGTVSTFQIWKLTFSTANVLSGLVVFILAFAVIFFTSRHVSMRPSKGQNFLEWLIDFTNGILKGSIPAKEVSGFGLWGFTLFLFLFLSNQLGLFFNVAINGSAIVRSPTSDPIVTLTMSMMTVVLANYAGLKKWGTKGYLASFVKPSPMFLASNLFEQVSSFLTLGLRIFGIIFSGEVLLEMVWSLAELKGIPTLIAAVPIEMAWQGLSVFLGSIQAYVFLTLSSVYIGRQLEGE